VTIFAPGSDSYFENGLRVEPGEVLELGWIELQMRSLRRAQVVDAETGNALSGVTVIFVEEGSLGMKPNSSQDRARNGETRFQQFDQRMERKSDDSGNVFVPMDPSLRTLVIATHPEYATTIPAVFPPDREDLKIEMTVGLAAEVIVLGGNGPEPGVIVRHEMETTDHRSELLGVGHRPLETAVSDQSGVCLFTHLSPGVHRFRIDDDKYDWTSVRLVDANVARISLSRDQ
jgi:hypothetical protein